VENFARYEGEADRGHRLIIPLNGHTVTPLG
jgi:hypothetical protein